MKPNESIVDFDAALSVIDDLLRRGDAETAFSRLTELENQRPDKHQKNILSVRLIQILIHQGQIDAAQRRMKTVIKKRKESVDPGFNADLAIVSSLLGALTGQTASAIKDLQSLVEDSSLSPMKRNAALTNLACLFRDSGQWFQAIDLLTQLIQNPDSTPDEIARAALIVAEIHLDLELDQVAPWIESVLTHAAKSGAWEMVKCAEIIRTLSRFRQGDLDGCLRELNSHLNEADQLMSIQPRIMARLAIAEYLIFFGDDAEARLHLSDSKTILDSVNLSGLTSHQTKHELLWIETLPWRRSRDAAFESLDRLEIILAVISKYPRLPGVVPVWWLSGRIQAALGLHDNARKSFQRALTEAQKNRSNRQEARILHEMALLDWNSSRSESELSGSERNKILSNSTRALDCAMKAGDLETEWLIHAFRGRVFLDSNEHYPATGELETASQQLLSLIESIADPDLIKRYRMAAHRAESIRILEPYLESSKPKQSAAERRSPPIRPHDESDDGHEDVRKLHELIRALGGIHGSTSTRDLMAKLLRTALSVLNAERIQFIPHPGLQTTQKAISKSVSETADLFIPEIPREWNRDITDSIHPLIFFRQPTETDIDARTVICASLKDPQPLGVIQIDRPARLGVFTSGDASILESMIQTALLTHSILSMRQRLADLTDQFRREITPEYPNIIGQSGPMRDVFNLIHRVSSTEISVLITGETGTGKDLVARTIHDTSIRKHSPFVYLDCSAIPVALIEAELFGIEKGVATGVEQRVGLLEYANGGTIVLDEITEIPLSTQAKLLRVLQERDFEPVGSNRTVKVDIRLISTTSKDILKSISEQRVREDFYYRLNGITIDIPPLRKRDADILLLARTFLQRYNSEFKKSIRGFTPETIDAMLDYPWPGNVRELDHAIRKAVLFSQRDDLDLEDLNGTLHQYRSLSFDERVKQFEMTVVNETLKRFGGDRAESARVLGIPKTTLDRLLKRSDSRQRKE